MGAESFDFSQFGGSGPSSKSGSTPSAETPTASSSAADQFDFSAFGGAGGTKSAATPQTGSPLSVAPANWAQLWRGVLRNLHQIYCNLLEVE